MPQDDAFLNILDVKVSNAAAEDILDTIMQFLESREKYYITTPNPEMLVEAQKDEEFRQILNYADIAAPDGFGLQLAAILQGTRLKSRMTGVDLVWKLADIAEVQQYRIALLGGEEDVARLAAEHLKRIFPNLPISYFEVGAIENPKVIDSNLIAEINRAQPDILLVALGHGKQERFIFYNLDRIPSIKIAAGVGGAFDYIAGTVRRAPRWMQRMGLEWLYRLFHQPKKRMKRVANAVFVFPYLVIKHRIQHVKN